MKSAITEARNGSAMLPDRSFFNRLAEAAKAETLPRFRSGLSVVNKLASGFDPVTEGDQAAEVAIRRLIEEHYPEHGILGEEHGSVGLDREYVWVIDPIDGTRACISGGLDLRGRSGMTGMGRIVTPEAITSKYFVV